MAKKILAVVLAVMMALSAMAITAFADDIIIDLYNANQNLNKANNTVTVTFDIPVYGLYGYLTAGDYFTLELPRYFGGEVPADKTIKWSVVVDSTSWTLKSDTTTSSVAVSDPKQVVISYWGHNYDGTNTAVPQATGYNQTSSIRVVATIENVPLVGGWKTPSVDATSLFVTRGWTGPEYGDQPSPVKAQWYTNNEAINGNVSYVMQWSPAASTNDTTKAGEYNFVSAEWTSSLQGTIPGTEDTAPWTGNGSAAGDAAYPLTWDHTMKNRGDIYSYAGTTVELVVELKKPIIGQATYTLYAKGGDTPYTYNQSYWWQYSNQRKYITQQTVVGKANELVFEVPIEVLLDGTYGAFNTEFAICENITLLNANTMKDYLNVDRAKVGNGDGKYGPISWRGWTDRIQYNNEDVNYAKTGVAGTLGADVTATKIYLRLPEIDTGDSNVDIDNPQQDTGNVTDDPADGDEMNAGDQTEDPKEEDNTPAPSESENPPTGIALAVIPMILAAAAAVVAKKH